MKNYIQEGCVIDVVAGAAYSSGDPILVGGFVGVCVTDIASGATGAVRIEGVVEMSKVSAQAWAAGDRIYWDVSLSKFTNVKDTDTQFAGIAVEAAANPSSTGKFKLNEGAPQAAVIAALAQTISGTYSQSEVQAISTKVDAILVALKNAGLMASA